jgi:2-iminobutanoate/2-iminopropanoate deaminase
MKNEKNKNKKIQSVYTDKAPQAIGPYSQAVKLGELIFTSGQLGIDASTGKLISDDIKAQTEQVLKNLENVLIASNSDFNHVLETMIFMVDLSSFAIVNKIYSERIGEHKPARATVQVSALPLNAKIEIKMTAAAKTK